MAINSVGYNATILGRSVQNINAQLADLQAQLTTGKKSTTYSGMGVNEGFAIAARSQLSNITAFTDTASKVQTTIDVANTAIQSLAELAKTTQNAVTNTSQTLNSMGQTIAQQNASAQFSTMIGILNTRSGDRYIFSGSAIDTPSVAPDDVIMNGSGTQVGLKQIISERRQADLGASGMGRLAVTQPTTTSVSVAEDVAGSPFGLKLGAISSSLTGATVNGPTGSPPAISVDLGATNPNDGDKVTFTFNLPDGTTSSVQLTATTTTPAPTGSFTIGATSDVTATNLNNALTSSIGKLANTELVAASALQAGNDFFGSPPLRVSGTPLNTATSLVNGTSTNTVSWYTGESGSGSARASSTARIDDSITVQYGARANEQALRRQLQNVAVLAAITTSPTDPNGPAQIAALDFRIAQNLSAQPGQQSIQDIQSDFAIAQATMKDASARQTQTKAALQTLVDQAESVAPEEAAAQILALQTQLQASYQTTSMLSQLSLAKFL